MSDYEDYNADDDQISYHSDDANEMDQGEDGLNLEDNFIEAEHAENPIEAYKLIIELEISNSTSHQWSFKSYEKLCQIYIKNLNFDEFKTNVDKLFELFSKVDDVDKQDTIRNIIFSLSEVKDDDFKEKILNEMLKILEDKKMERAYLDTGREYCKILLKTKKYDILNQLIPDLLKVCNSSNDEIYKSIKLELLVIQIDLCKVSNDISTIKELYLEAKNLMNEQIFDDKRLSAIINEEGGKIDLRQKEFDKALQKFKVAFHNYKESGDNQAITVLKYAFLASLITRDKSIIVSPEEAKIFQNDKNLNSMVNLYEAYESMDINLINSIWNKEIKNNEKDPFILENLNEILYNIRLNFVINKLKAYRFCKFQTISKELGIKKEELVPMIMKIAKNGYANIKINLVNDYIEMEKDKNEKSLGGLIDNYNSWLNIMNKQ